MFRTLSDLWSFVTNVYNSSMPIPTISSKKRPQTLNLLDLPTDLILHIFLHLNFTSLKNTFLISSRFGKLLQDKNMCELITKKFSETIPKVNDYDSSCLSTKMVYRDNLLASHHLESLYLHKFPDGKPTKISNRHKYSIEGMMFRNFKVFAKLRNVLCILYPLNPAKPETILYSPVMKMEDPSNSLVAFESTEGLTSLCSFRQKRIWVWDEEGKMKYKFLQEYRLSDLNFQRCFSDLKIKFAPNQISPENLDLLSKLPVSVIIHIIGMVELKDHRSMRLVSRMWNRAAKKNSPPTQLVCSINEKDKYRVNVHSMQDGSVKTIPLLHPIVFLATSPNFIATASRTQEGQEILLFDPLTLKKMHRINFKGETIYNLIVQKNRLYILSGKYGIHFDSLHCVDLNSIPIECPQKPILSHLRALSIDGDYVASSYEEERKVTVMNVQTQMKVAEFLLKDLPISILFKNGRYLFVRHYTGKILRWTLKDDLACAEVVTIDSKK